MVVRSGPQARDGGWTDAADAADARVARLGFGGAPIGNLYSEVSDDVAAAAIEAAWQAGIRHFDTAPFYGYGLSERRLGRVLAGRGGQGLVLSTKVGRRIEDDAGARQAGDGFAVAGWGAGFG